ncbi:MAG TPA: ABC transporter ATP-binding protein [Solirubrobacteraceae bacterium]|nr:ABC transporter ATP-binding protein [Solirubrobacteraceae bacterium]
MGTTAIEVQGLLKSYDGELVLRELSFAVGGGEIFGICGRNGAGKTTTVEILQGLRSRDGGHVEVLGLDPARDRARLRPLVGAQLQSSALPERLRVGEALRLFARIAGDVVDWRALADEWRLGDLLRRSYGALSGGQRQRLFLALALVNRPRLVFLDELTQGLDPVARRETWQLVDEVRDRGTTVVLVTHDMDEAQQLCDRVAVLHDGHLLACGTPAELVATMSTRVRFSSPGSSVLQALKRLPGVDQIAYDGALADITADPRAIVHIAAQLADHDVVASDFTVIRPSLEDAVVSLMNGSRR